MISLVLNSHPPRSEEASDEILQIPTSMASRICEKYGDSVLAVPRNPRKQPAKETREQPLKRRPPCNAEHTEQEHVGVSYTVLPRTLHKLIEPHICCQRSPETQTILFSGVSNDPPFRILKHPHLSFEDVRVAALMHAAIRHDPEILEKGVKNWLIHVCTCTDNIHAWWSSVT